MLAAELQLIDQNRDRQRPEIEAFNAALRDSIGDMVRARRREFEEHENLAKRMGVRMTADSAPAPGGRSTGVAPSRATKKEWDVFVSYAGEDRESVAKPLADALKAKGLRVWFDKFELAMGDRLRRKIDEGLVRSRFGVVVLSPSFFRKHWTRVELDGLVQREIGGRDMILPVWHDIDRERVATHSPTLADRVAEPWSNGVEAVVASILAAMERGPLT